MVSADGGQTWDRSQPVQLALSAKNNVGWPVTLQLKDGSLLTAYALTAYLNSAAGRICDRGCPVALARTVTCSLAVRLALPPKSVVQEAREDYIA